MLTHRTVLYVSPSGNDSWSGKLPEPEKDGSDGPFATLEKARDTIRSIKNAGRFPSGEITVFIRGGTYRIAEPFILNAGDSGTGESPVFWQAYPGEQVIFTGGISLTGFKPVADPAVIARIGTSYRDSILVTDLKAPGITRYGDIDPRSGHRPELFFKRTFMTIARYPNDGWLTIADVPQSGERRINEGLDRDTSPVPRGRHYGRFTYDGDRPDRWAESDDIWVHGYWTWDWADEYLNVAKIDRKKREIYPREPHHGYGYTKGQRFYFLNILEELDAPGEWYIDKGSGMLYFWPPAPIGEGDVQLSLLESDMVRLEGTSHITISGVIFQTSRGCAVHITGGANTTVAGCTFRNLGNTAVVIDGGTDNGVLSCDIYDVAAGGVILNGGDHKILTPAHNYAVNNHIHDYGVRIKTYTPAVQVTGVGNRVAHNLIHDAPHTGIFLVTSNVGNDHIIEYNELHSLAKETGDVGAIYLCARDFTFRGTVIRYNYLHDIQGPGHFGAMAMYLDDFTSGTTIYGNICYRASRAVLVGGGRNNTVDNNIFIECDPSIHVDGRGLGWAKYYFEQSSGFRSLMDAVNYREPPYSERYPELLTLQDDDPAAPKYNTITRNISSGGRWLDLYDGLDFDIVAVKNNLIADPVLCKWLKKGSRDFIDYPRGDREMRDILTGNGNEVIDTDPGFSNPEGRDFRLRDDSPALRLGFKPIPFEKIGLYTDDYRTRLSE